MPSEFRRATLGEVAEIVMGQSPPGHTYNEAGIGTPLVNGPAQFGDSTPITTKWTTAPTKLSEQGDVVFCVRGSTTGRMVRSDGEYCLGRGVAAIRGEVDRDSDFIYYGIGAGLDRLLQQTTGSTFPNLSSRSLSRFDVPWPEAPLRHAIAEVLKALDARIEWCRVIEATSLDLLTALFAEAASGSAKVGDVAEVIAGQSPPGSTYNTEGQGLPFFQGSAQFGSLVPTVEKWCSAPQRTAEPGDVLFSVRAPVGALNVSIEQVCIGRGLAAIRSPFRAASFAAVRMAASAWAVHDGSGTVFGSINGRDLRATEVPWPPEVGALEPALEALLDRALSAVAESRSVERVRDALLPRLLSGELRIENPERLLEGVA